nr:hypothetical protein [Pedobacter panaciterrae]
MLRNFFLALILILELGCKKNNGDDVTVYKWKRDLYRAVVTNEGPAVLTSSNPKLNKSIYVDTDFVLLTEAQKSKQQDSIFNASARMLAYKYEKVNR